MGDDFRFVSGKCQVVYPGIEPFSIKNKSEAKGPVSMLFVGTPPWHKGFPELVEAIRRISEIEGKERVADRLHITCVVGEVDKARSYINELGDFINIVGLMDNSKLLRNYFMKSDIFYMASHYEIFGMVYLEAFACGIPAIGVAQYSTPEIIESTKNGFLLEAESCPLDQELFPSRDKFNELSGSLDETTTQNLVRLLRDIINDVHDLKLMGTNAHKLISGSSKFSLNSRKQQLKKIYEEAVL